MDLAGRQMFISNTCDSCNMDTGDLPDMHAQGPRIEGIHIRQIFCAQVITITITYTHVYVQGHCVSRIRNNQIFNSLQFRSSSFYLVIHCYLAN